MTTYQYQGTRGEFISGIPARDLTERDVARLSDEQLEQLTTKGSDGKQLYTKKSAPKGDSDGKADAPKPSESKASSSTAKN